MGYEKLLVYVVLNSIFATLKSPYFHKLIEVPSMAYSSCSKTKPKTKTQLVNFKAKPRKQENKREKEEN